jgi:hypothetical protein
MVNFSSHAANGDHISDSTISKFSAPQVSSGPLGGACLIEGKRDEKSHMDCIRNSLFHSLLEILYTHQSTGQSE